MAEGGKPFISLAVVGPHGSGKTTVVARLVDLVGAFAEEQHRHVRSLAKDLGRPCCEHGWMLDSLTMERERGCTVEASLASFESGSFRYAIIDAPGSCDFAKNMLSVTSLADIALLVVPAPVGEFEANLETGRLKELALCCFTMGIKNIAVLVSKMDDTSVAYSMSRFDEIKKAVSTFLKEVGYKQKDPPFIPISGLFSDNLTTKSSETNWYGGAPIVDALDAMGPTINRPAEKPLRLPVLKAREVPDVGTVVVGRVETGSLRTGIKVIFSPTGQVAEVRSMHLNGERVQEAKGGDIVGFSIGESLRPSDIQRGMVISSASNDPAADAEAFIAQVVVLDHPGSIRAGYCPAIAVHTAHVACEFEELLSKMDRKTGKEVEANPKEVKSNEIVLARLRPRAPVCVEAFSAYPSLGRFAVRDHGRVVAVGVVKEVTKRSIPKVRSGNENQYFDNT